MTARRGSRNGVIDLFTSVSHKDADHSGGPNRRQSIFDAMIHPSVITYGEIGNSNSLLYQILDIRLFLKLYRLQKKK